MKKFVVTVFLIFAGIKYGWEYVNSDKFQEYGDKTKAPWTCKINNTMGHLYMIMSQYRDAMKFFNKTISRCPDSEMCEVAEFETAECLSKSGRPREAIEAYKAFAEKYKGTKRAKIADRATQIINAS